MKKVFTLALAGLFALAALAGCGGAESSLPEAVSESRVNSVAEATPRSGPEPGEMPQAEPATIRIAGLKGPTTMGMVKLMADAEAGETKHEYQVEMFGTADEIVPKLVSGELDVAAIPANLASVLYNNTSGGVRVAAINTLGVLYVVETGDSVQTIEDLRGKTVYSTGKGTTPEFALNYILEQNGIGPATDVIIEYKSESTEIAAQLAAGTDAIAVLPQPYVTGVQMQNPGVRVALSLSSEWDKVGEGSSLVTGVLAVRTGFLEDGNNALAFWGDFLPGYEASIEWVNANVPEAAELVARHGIVEKAPVAEKAIPECNIVYIDGDEMETKLAGYLEVLYAQLPESVGGTLPGEDFYLTGSISMVGEGVSQSRMAE